jgi:hypothetical protein
MNCHYEIGRNKMFLKTADQFLAQGVSNILANYMTMALDPNVAPLVKFMENKVPGYTKQLDQLQVSIL